ncbi:hypothetical protein FB567DRAFT_355180 [Paraphoma chrysanthemicola]|uniref:DH domain-containing protein n=1 Tax=Paraphoma chrysanthemicola TaxID=798071 RepID=A0A8K0R632_9PLEO|nr:hypothetical protein FB567DRAFT_355180 [Paraphoma chrysanthemicola]
MEPVSALFGVMAALPQCIQSAKELYDLRSRYKDASILITAIYSESMVIAASLSQVQNLLQHDALQSKPQLLETFDRALTGCRVVYGCLEEEVRDLVAKADADELKFKDRAKFLWKEDTFKELLTQIRGQQSALSLLIQGLQMESIADIRKLIEENSATLDKVVKRSKTLRQSHPRVTVPESLFNHEVAVEDAAEAESIIKSTEFTFDDEVINSRAYRRAMALYTSTSETKATEVAEEEVGQDEPPAYDASRGVATLDEKPVAIKGHDDGVPERATWLKLNKETKEPAEHPEAATNERDVFESIENDLLPYMPRITSTAPHLSSLRTTVVHSSTDLHSSREPRPPIRSPSEDNALHLSEHAPPHLSEHAPPLPPRRPSGQQLHSYSCAAPVRSSSLDDSIESSQVPSVLSKVSTSSSYTSLEQSSPNTFVSRKPLRKPLPLRHQVSQDVLSTVYGSGQITGSPVAVPSLKNVRMHDIWMSLIIAEQKCIDRLIKFRKMFYDNVLQHWPLLEKHLEAIPICEQLAQLNKELLLQPFEEQAAECEDATCDALKFEVYTGKIQKLYREYCQRMPHARSSLRTTQSVDPKFDPFVNTVGLSIAWFGKSWEHYLELPITQLDIYAETMQSLLELAETLPEPAAVKETTRLKRALQALQWLRTMVSATLEDAQSREAIQNLEKRIHTLDSNIFSQLRLLDSARRVRHQGSMAIKLKGQGPWHPVHVMLLDNYLLWGKVKSQKKGKGQKIVVLDAPIAVPDLDISSSCDHHQFQKATMFDEIPRGSMVYTITIGSRSKDSKPHVLGAFGVQELEAWLEHFTAATIVQSPGI